MEGNIMEVEIGKKYRHYKGNMYEVLCIAKHSETLEEMANRLRKENGYGKKRYRNKKTKTFKD